MTILFDAARPVNRNRTFGRGLLRSLPSYRADHTAADEAWLAEDDARREAEAREYDRIVDEMAAEAEALARLEAGCLL